MASTTPRKSTAPLTFDVSPTLMAKVDSVRRGHGLGSASEVVRMALEGFDFENCASGDTSHRQISVRVSSEHRANLKKYARKKNSSVGELIRYALEALPAKPRK